MNKSLKLVFVLFMAIALAACSSGNGGATVGTGSDKADNGTKTPGGDGEQIELKLAFPAQDGNEELLEQILQPFYEENPGITVTPVWVPNSNWTDYITKIQTMVAGGNSPDVMRVAIQGAALTVSENLVLPLNDFMERYPDAVEDYDDYHPKLQSAFEFDDQIYGFTWDWNPMVIHFNKTMLDEVGLDVPGPDWTIDDFMYYAETLTRERNGQQVYGFALPHNYFSYSAWLFNNEASVLNEDFTESTLDEPNAIEVFQFMQDLVHEHGFAPVPSPDTNYMNQFITEQVAMIGAGLWPFTGYDQNEVDFVEVQMFPTWKTNEAVFGNGAYMVMEASEHQDAAFKLAAYLGGPYSQEFYLDYVGVPTRQSVMEKKMPDVPVENWHVFTETADIARPVESPSQYTAVETIFNRYISAIMSGQTDAETAMKQAKEEIDQALQQ